MHLSEIPRNPDLRTLRQFAVLWAIAFTLLAAWQHFGHGRADWGMGLLIVALAGGIAGLSHPPLLRNVFVGWMFVSFPFGWLVRQTLLALMFYGVFTPLGLMLRLCGHDALRLSKPEEGTYWQEKAPPPEPAQYLRQY